MPTVPDCSGAEPRSAPPSHWSQGGGGSQAGLDAASVRVPFPSLNANPELQAIRVTS